MKNKVVLVTGGTSGIGLSMAHAFMQEGAAVVVCARSPAGIEQFSNRYPDAMAIQADVTRPDQRAAMLVAIAGRYGRLDVLVNNAGTFVERDFADDREVAAGLEQELGLNLTAPIQLTGEVLARWPALASIVFVSSGFALVSPTRAPTYGAAKAGLHAFADSLRRQLAHKGIHVLEVLPATTDTPMNADFKGKKMPPEQVAAAALAALKQRRPMALIGPVRWLPTLLRIAPGLTQRMVAAT